MPPASPGESGGDPSSLLEDLGERRQFPRHPAEFPVRILEKGVKNGAGRIEARALNISESGLLLDLPRHPNSAKLLLDFCPPPGTLPDSYIHRFRIPGRVVRMYRTRNPQWPRRIAVKLEGSIGQEARRGVWKKLRWVGALLLLLALGNIIFLKIQNLEYFWYRVIWGVYSIGVTTYILSRFLISAFYRPPRDTGHRPSVSVIVAAKNEERAITETLQKIYESDYPQELMEVIAIDDGSTDGTYAEMERIREEHPGLRLIRFSKNRGKRHAMAEGARVASKEILVYVDSDSFLDRDALKYLVQGFHDPEVAAVAAQGEVANPWKNALTRTQAVWYFLAFNVLKAAESVFSSVTCCSGCCSAYRRSAVLEVLDPWLNQRFLGRPATFGDDRSLTNFMLRRYKVLYESRSRVRTIVPETYRQFLRQQLRWKKSWLRETFIAARFMWKRPPIMAFSFFGGLIFPLLGPLVVLRALIYLPVVEGRPGLFYLVGVFLMSLLYSSYFLFRKRSRFWIYGSYFCLLYMSILIWQLPWAILTSWNNRWGTR